MMAMHNGETVGDMIVRTRREAMRENPAEAKAIAARFTPRTIRYQTWPPTARELANIQARGEA